MAPIYTRVIDINGEYSYKLNSNHAFSLDFVVLGKLVERQ